MPIASPPSISSSSAGTEGATFITLVSPDFRDLTVVVETLQVPGALLHPPCAPKLYPELFPGWLPGWGPVPRDGPPLVAHHPGSEFFPRQGRNDAD